MAENEKGRPEGRPLQRSFLYQTSSQQFELLCQLSFYGVFPGLLLHLARRMMAGRRDHRSLTFLRVPVGG